MLIAAGDASVNTVIFIISPVTLNYRNFITLRGAGPAINCWTKLDPSLSKRKPAMEKSDT